MECFAEAQQESVYWYERKGRAYRRSHNFHLREGSAARGGYRYAGPDLCLGHRTRLADSDLPGLSQPIGARPDARKGSLSVALPLFQAQGNVALPTPEAQPPAQLLSGHPQAIHPELLVIEHDVAQATSVTR
jgi:hypothetical protein